MPVETLHYKVMKKYSLIFGMVFLCSYAKSDDSNLKWNGFFTLGGAKTNQKLSFDDGVGPQFNYSSLSKFGITGTSEIENDLEAMFQIVARGDRSPNFNSAVDFALINWRLGNSSKFSIGRQRIGTWLISDYINVGSLYPWVRPPLEVYSLNPLTSANGLSWTGNWLVGAGEILFETDVIGGSTEFNLSPTTRVKTNKDLEGWGASLAYNQGAFSARVGAIRARVSVTYDQQIALSNVGIPAPGLNVVAPVNLDFGYIDFQSIGARYDDGDYAAYFEYANQSAERIVKRRAGTYLTLGKYLFSEKLGVFLTQSYLLAGDFDNDYSIDLSPGVPLFPIDSRQSTQSITFVYKMRKSLDVKLEFSETSFPDEAFAMGNPTGTIQTPNDPNGFNKVQTVAFAFDSSF